ncbi:flagellin [Paracoccus actinidiae]|jgi:flagellin|uniref:flagellin n=1 Tax=Paracoccus actinidiae TaxID=3064531 RepID=UPI0027D1F8B4|nr:flagellin [Paracoccus sp. M09]
MSSILTNNGAIVALQTLKNVNASLNKAQSEISTGKAIGNAKDNAAIWAVSKIMETDVTNLKAVGSGLSTAGSTVATARVAVESVAEDLKTISDKIVQSQSGVGTTALQADIEGLVENIKATIDGAQFQGVNLLKGTGNVSYLSSLNRDDAGNVNAAQITVTKKDLGAGDYTAAAVFTGTTGASTNADTFGTSLNAAGTTTIALDGTVAAEGDKLSISIGGKTASYTVTAEDVAAASPSDLIAVGMKKAIEALGIEGLTVDYDSANAGELVLANGGAEDLAVSGQYRNAGAGELAALDSIDVTTDTGRANALGAIKSLIDTITTKGAELGSVESQIEKQGNFISKLSDALTTGIGSMVDADMEEASARLQALQTQQQLGIQALSIANQAPSAILSLFR